MKETGGGAKYTTPDTLTCVYKGTIDIKTVQLRMEKYFCKGSETDVITKETLWMKFKT